MNDINEKIINESEINSLKKQIAELESQRSWQDEDIENLHCKIDDLEAEVTNLGLEIKNVESERDDFKNKYLYALAEMDNVRKHLNERISNVQKYKEESLLKDLVGVYDLFQNSTEYLNEHENEDENYKGMLLIFKDLSNVLDKYDFKCVKINPGDMFDENIMEAVSTVAINDKDKDMTIASTLSNTYTYKDKILKYGKVIVNKFE